MEKRILMVSTAILLAALLASLVVLTHFSAIHSKEAKREQMEWLHLSAFYGNQTEGVGVRRRQLSVELPENMEKEGVSIENNYMEQKIAIQISGVEEGYFDNHSFFRRMDHIKGIRMAKDVMEITMDAIYEVEDSIEDGYLYLDFLAPWQVYDQIVVIDPGHGGSASGDIKQKLMEKDLNLAIALQLKAILEEESYPVGVYYTRTDDTNPSFEKRLQLAEKVRADFLLGIHSNSTADGQMSEEHGTEVMYDELKEDGGKRLAEICLEEVTKSLGSKQNGIFPGNRDYFLRNSQVPTASIELGYMTNLEELEKLASPKYQKQAAQGICNAMLRALEEGIDKAP